MSKGSGIVVTVKDTKTGDTETREIPANDYNIICVGACYIAHTNVFANGTHVLTIKGRGPQAASAARAAESDEAPAP